MKKWYVITTYAGYEEKVKKNLEKRMKESKLEDSFGRILIPTQQVFELKKGKKVLVNRRFFPGYILIEMEMNENTFELVRRTPQVSGFVGTSSGPEPLPEEEVEEIIKRIESPEKPKLDVSFEVGNSVKIIEGPFTGFVGKIEEVNYEKTKLRILVTIFGRQTPVELDFTQVENI
jgi:transcriptional antiterminator NusG